MNGNNFVRPAVMDSTTSKIEMPCGDIFVIISTHDGKPMEVFCQLGHGGTCRHCTLEAIGRLCSLSLRNGIPASKVAKQLQALRCEDTAFTEDGHLLSCADGIAKLLMKYNGEVKG